MAPMDPDDAPHPADDPLVNPGAEYQTTAQTERTGPDAPVGAFAGGTGPGYAAGEDAPGILPRRTMIAQAAVDTFGQTGARLASAWIALVAVLAVFAPFLANSYPVTMRDADGVRHFPILASLTPVDVLLLIVFFVMGGYLLLARPSAKRFLWALAWVLAVGGGAAFWRTGLDHFRAEFDQILPFSLLDGSDLWLIAQIAGASLLVVAGAVVPPLLLPARQALPLGLALLLVVAVLAVFPVEAPDNPRYEVFREAQAAGSVTGVRRTVIPFSPNDRLSDLGNLRLKAPSADHWMGTTLYGEDVLSRMIYACRIALAIGFIATGIAVVIGVVLGGLMGYFGGIVDLVGMRFLEIIEAIPSLILLLIVMVSFGRNIYYMMITLGLIGWTGNARFIRAEFLKLRKQDFVQAAQAAGLPLRSILFRHMLPNGIAPVLGQRQLRRRQRPMLLESVLSFLGLGLLPEDPSWGQLLDQARKGGAGFNWWIATYPGLGDLPDGLRLHPHRRGDARRHRPEAGQVGVRFTTEAQRGTGPEEGEEGSATLLPPPALCPSVPLW